MIKFLKQLLCRHSWDQWKKHGADYADEWEECHKCGKRR